MNIENSTNVLLSKDINRIREGHDISKNSVLYSGILHLKNKDIEIRDLITTDITRDFNNAIADSIQVQFYMPSGDYQIDVVPELDTLEVKVTIFPDASLQFEPRFPKDSVAYDTIKIDSILRYRLLDFPKVNPATKRGLPVKTQFILPVIIKSE